MAAPFPPAGSSPRGPPRLHVTTADGLRVVLTNELPNGAVGPFPTPSEALPALAAADDPECCRLLRECARQVFHHGPLDRLAEWGDHLLCTEVGGGASATSVDVGRLKNLRLTNKRGLCGYTFKKGDICWNCRSCQTDPTCVQCDACYRNSEHTGHEVYFHHASPGGCCDCGDLSAWDRAGCCTAHSGPDLTQDPIDNLPATMQQPARVVFAEAVRLVAEACLHAVQGYNRMDKQRFLVAETEDEAVGLCVVRLHNDDVHTFNHVTDALRALRLSDAAAKTLTERVDADGHALVKRGAAQQLRPALALLQEEGLLVSMVDEAQMEREERAARLLSWLTQLATQVDGLARIVSELLTEAWPLGLSQLNYAQGTRWNTPMLRVSQPAPDDAAIFLSSEDASLPLSDPRLSSRLALLMVTDFFLTKKLRAELHALYLHLLVDLNFKPWLAKALTWVYPVLNGLYSRGVGTHEDSIFSFSVQLYTTASIVHSLATTTADEERLSSPGLLTVLTEAMLQALRLAGWREGHALPESFWEHPLLQHRRFSHVLRDLDYALQTAGTAAAVLQQSYPGPGPQPLANWIKLLGALQHADQVVRKTGAHLEFESTVWTAAFNLSLPVYSTSATLVNQGLKRPSLGGGGPEEEAPEAGGSSSGEDHALTPRMQGYAALTTAAVDALVVWVKRVQDKLYRGSWTTAEDRTSVPFRVHAEPVSFHLPLHRFLVAAVIEGTAQGLPLPTTLTDMPGIVYTAPYITDFPLRCLVLNAQVTVGLWRRNGLSIQGQAIHYATPPFCRVFRDLDLGAVQLGTLLGGNDMVLNLLVDRFSLRRWALDQPRTAGHERVGWREAGFEETPFEASDCVSLAEEALLLLILLVTELPRPAGPQHRDAVLRRELVHRLACKEGLTHSEVQQVTALADGDNGADGGGAFAGDAASSFDSILAGVATRRAGSDAARFDLRAECAFEYDGTFFHISRQEHEAALERVLAMRKQAAARGDASGSPKPCVAAPPPVHADFAAVRLLLFWPQVVTFQHTVLLAAVAKDGTSPLAAKRSPMLLVRCLHLLTLQLHVYADALRMEEEACQVEPPALVAYSQRVYPQGGAEEQADEQRDRPVRDFFAALTRPRPSTSTAAGGSARPPRRRKRRGSSLVADQRLAREEGGGEGDQAEAGLEEEQEEEEFEEEDEEEEEEVPVVAGPSILQLLVELAQDSSHQGLNIGALYEEGLQWVLGELADTHVARFPAAVEAETLLRPFAGRSDEAAAGGGGGGGGGGKGKGKGKGGAGSRSEQARRAQAKAMSFLKQQQSKFWDEQMEAADEEQDEASSLLEDDPNNPSLEVGAPACLYCHERTGAALGHIGFAQRSNALANAIEASAQHAGIMQRYRVSHRECLVRAGAALDSVEVTRLKRGTGLVVEEKRGRRLRISSPVEGWVSELTADQARLVEPMKRYCFQSWGRTRLVVSMCGHAVHQDCWDAYYASVLQQLISEDRLDGRHAIDVNRREFLCPLCKTLCNVLVPHIPPQLRPNHPAQPDATTPPSSTLQALVAWTGGGLEAALLAPLTATESGENASPGGLPDVLVRNMRRFADSLGEVLDVPWSRLMLEGEEGGRGSLGSGPKKLIKALHVGWSAAAHSLLLEVVNRHARGSGNDGVDASGSRTKNEQDRQAHLRKLLGAVTGMSTLSGDTHYLGLAVLRPLARLLAGGPLVSADEGNALSEKARDAKLRKEAMHSLPLAMVLDHEVYGPDGVTEGVSFERLRKLHRDRRAAGEPGVVEAWPFFERPLLAHDLATLAVGAMTLSLHSPPDALRLAQVLAVARLAQALLEPLPGKATESMDTTDKKEGAAPAGGEQGSASGSLRRLQAALFGESAISDTDCIPGDWEATIISRWRPFLQLLVALGTALGLQPADTMPAMTVPELFVQLGLPEALLSSGEETEVEALASLVATWGEQYRTFNRHVPRLLGGDTPEEDEDEPPCRSTPPAEIDRPPFGLPSPPATGLGAPPVLLELFPAPALATDAAPMEQVAAEGEEEDSYADNEDEDEEEEDDEYKEADLQDLSGHVLATWEALRAGRRPDPAFPLATTTAGVPSMPPPEYHAVPYLSLVDGSATAPDLDLVRMPVPSNAAGEALPLYDLSHFGVSDEVLLRLVPLPQHYTELYGLLKQQYWALASTTGSGGGGNGGSGSGSRGAGAGGGGRGIEDPAICLLCGAVLAAGPRMHGRTRLAGPGVCTLHTRGCGSGNGMMLLVNKGTTLLFRDSRAIFYTSPYVDVWGEEDPNLRRGRPLSLSRTRYESLGTLYRDHGTAAAVASRRLHSDRVIRENYY